jgi:thiol-disulfide isomerase/thioredoxin
MIRRFSQQHLTPLISAVMQSTRPSMAARSVAAFGLLVLFALEPFPPDRDRDVRASDSSSRESVEESSQSAVESQTTAEHGNDAPFPRGELRLVNDDFAVGQLANSDTEGRVRWQADGFTSPFEFDVPAIRSVRFPEPDERGAHPVPSGAYGFELEGGDFLYGNLRDLTERELTIEVSSSEESARTYAIDRSIVRRIVLWQEGNALIHEGPRGLDGWKLSPENHWFDDGGQLASKESESNAFADVGLPEQARLELEFNWKSSPNFAIALGVDDTEESQQFAFRLEAWQDELVLVREREQDADVVFLQKLAPSQGSVRLQIYFDQPRDRMLVYSSTGSRLGELSFPVEKGSKPQSMAPQRGIQIVNSGGEFRLERLRIIRWNGEPPRTNQGDGERVYLADGTVRQGTLRRFRPDSQQFVMDVDGREVTILQEQFESAVFDPQEGTPDGYGPDPDKQIRVIGRDGGRMAGKLKQVADGELWLEVPGFRQPWRTPLDQLQSLVVLQFDVPSTPAGGRIGRLEIPGIRLQGQLSEGTSQEDATCFVWHPRGSRTASPLLPEVDGRIIYREPRAEPTSGRSTAARRVMPAPQVGVVGGFFRALTGESSSGTRSTRSVLAKSLHLRTGDVIPGEVTRIDESGVIFKTPVTDAEFVPHEKIKSLDLDMAFGSPKTDPVKQERLLTLPRMQRNNPPTHLIVSRNGDYLRTRLISLDGKEAHVEVRLERQVIPRDRIAQIIWLHDDELEPREASPATQEESRSDDSTSTTERQSPEESSPAGREHRNMIRIQALRQDGIRLTFHAERVEGEAIIGSSDILGDCQVEIDEVDQLLLGDMIEQAASRLASNRWRLHHSPDPRYLEEAGANGNGRRPGSDSPLVGETAPEIKLPLLAGGQFQLDQYRGQVVVLDFWASWCGPCLQSMPQIERAVGQFDDQQVVLIAVNLQETPDVIRSTLERWNLEPQVALDRDGVVAQRYQVTAIPQTVIIDREGKVARLFVGGGPSFEESLQAALEEVVGE